MSDSRGSAEPRSRRAARLRDRGKPILAGARRHFFPAVSIFSAMALVFILGLALGFERKPPSHIVASAISAFADLGESGSAYFLDVPIQHLEPKRHLGSGVTVANMAEMQPGVTFMTGLFGNRLGARLYAADGRLLHEWPMDLFEVAPEWMQYPFDALVHGDLLYENGDVVANLEARGMFRFNACGEILWQNRDLSHHSISVDDDGYIWAPVVSPDYRDLEFLPGPFMFDRIGRFDSRTGVKIDEIDLVESVRRSDKLGLVLANTVIAEDVMHLNDVEVLTADKAAAFPQFDAGDLLLSSRHFNQIWVLDGRDHTIKWTFMGPMVAQHDPDFQPDGTITLLDNRPTRDGQMPTDPADVGDRGGSRILSIDPWTGRTETLYRTTAENSFYTPYRGKHHVLENGNILITETDGGRAFEVTPEGEVVWSFVNAYDEERVGWVMQATRFPPSYAAIGDVSCGGN